MTGALTTRAALDLYRSVLARSSHINEQLLLIGPLTNRVGASSRDADEVRAFLLRDHLRECQG